MILKTDKYNFSIVRNLDELKQARAAGELQVSTVCPECGKNFVRFPGEAEFILENGCKQHTK